MSADAPVQRLATSGSDPTTKRPYAVTMSVIRIFWLRLTAHVAMSVSAAAQSTQAAGSPQPPLIDRQKEIALALSARPPSVASTAAVYVLDESGCAKVRDWCKHQRLHQ